MARIQEVRQRLEALKKKINDYPLARRWVIAAFCFGFLVLFVISGARLVGADDAASIAAKAELDADTARRLHLATLPAAEDGAEPVIPVDKRINITGIGAIPLDSEGRRWVAGLYILDWQELVKNPDMGRAPSENGIFIIDRKDGSRKLVLKNIDKKISYYLAGVSPDGQRILVHRENEETHANVLCLVRLNTQQVTTLDDTENASGRASCDTAGNIYFSTLIRGKSSALYRASPPTYTPHLLLEENGRKSMSVIADPAVTLDAKNLFFRMTSRDEQARKWVSSIHRLDLQTGRTEKLCDGEEHALAGDLNGLVYSYRSNGNREVYYYDFDSRKSVQITKGEGFAPVVSGKILYFSSTRKYANVNLFMRPITK